MKALEKYIAKDKQLHFIVGVIISLMLVVLQLGVYAFAVTFIVAWVKEIADKVSGRGTFDPMDAVFTFAPGLFVTGLYLL